MQDLRCFVTESHLRRGLRLISSSIQGLDRFRVMACYQGRFAHMLVSVALWSVLFLASGLSSLLTWCGHLLNLFCVGLALGCLYVSGVNVLS